MSIENLFLVRISKILKAYDNATSYWEQKAAVNELMSVARRMVGGEDFEAEEARKQETMEKLSENIEKLKSLHQKLNQELRGVLELSRARRG